MTQNQIAYHRLQEEHRANLAREKVNEDTLLRKIHEYDDFINYQKVGSVAKTVSDATKGFDNITRGIKNLSGATGEVIKNILPFFA